MATLLEYAALSAFIYNNERGNRSSVNTIALPPGWEQLRPANGFLEQTGYDTNTFSFTAGAFLNHATGEIVISYKGTDFLLEFAGRAWNTVGDVLTDLSAGVGGLVSTAQFLQAATYYQDVKRWAQTHGIDTSRISFTGHSLGGGIASVMTAWFNRPATTFAEAPFEATARSARVLTSVGAALMLRNDEDPAFNAFYQDWLARGGPLGLASNPELLRRETLVSNRYVQGEFLNFFRTEPATIFSINAPILIGEQPITRAVDLHSMNLHLALLCDERLRAACVLIPELIPALIDKNGFAADPNSATRDFVTTLVADQVRGELTRADGLLGHFSSEVQRLAGVAGTAVQPKVRAALIAAAMEQCLQNPAAKDTQLFTSSNNAVHFNVADLSANSSTLKSPSMLANVTWSLAEEAGNSAEITARVAEAWHVQTGSGAMTWTAASGTKTDVALGGAQSDTLDADAGNDLLLGLDGADTLRGGEGGDVLVGGNGTDTLDGGAGLDALYGGADADTYRFTGNFGSDQIIDSDGQGRIEVDGQQVSGANAKKLREGAWADDEWLYSLVPNGRGGNDLILQRNSSLNQIRVRNWVDGGLGIRSTNMVTVHGLSFSSCSLSSRPMQHLLAYHQNHPPMCRGANRSTGVMQ